MRPNTPHVVFTAEHSVCIGGHFLATTTLRDTCYGIFHSFVAGTVVTNTKHVREVFMLLARIMAFYHIAMMGAEDDSDGEYAGLDKSHGMYYLLLQFFCY